MLWAMYFLARLCADGVSLPQCRVLIGVQRCGTIVVRSLVCWNNVRVVQFCVEQRAGLGGLKEDW